MRAEEGGGGGGEKGVDHERSQSWVKQSFPES